MYEQVIHSLQTFNCRFQISAAPTTALTSTTPASSPTSTALTPTTSTSSAASSTPLIPTTSTSSAPSLTALTPTILTSSAASTTELTSTTLASTAGLFASTTEFVSYIVSKDIGLCNRNNISPEEKLSILSFSERWIAPSYFNFPVRRFGNKDRKYVPSWENDFSWLRYSKSKDGAFCAYCFIFSPCNKDKSDVFTDVPFEDWRHAKESNRGCLLRHENSAGHIKSQESAMDFINADKNGSIATKLDTMRETKIKSNTEVMRALIGLTFLMAERGISFRGNWNHDLGEENSNFMSLVHWTAQFNPDLSNHLKNCPKNAKYLSPQIQNEFLECIGATYRDECVQRINQSPFFSILVDEVTDVSHTEQVGIIVRYIHNKGDANFEIIEDFLGFVAVEKTDALTLTTVIVKSLREWGINLDKLRGKGFDGASNMMGKKSGVTTLLREMFPRAKYTTHCRSHCLNLAVVYACRLVEVRNFMDRLRELTFFINYSPKRKPILRAKFQSEESTTDLLGILNDAESQSMETAANRHNLPSLCETRWMARIDTVSCLLAHYVHVMEALDEIQMQSTGQAASDARSFSLTLENFGFIMTAVVCQSVLSMLRPFSIKLQTVELDLIGAHEEAKILIISLKAMRTDEMFESLFTRACNIAKKIHGEHFIPQMPRVSQRSSSRSNAPSTSVKDYYKINLFFIFLDTAISHLESRFNDDVNGALKIAFLFPERLSGLSYEIQSELLEKFEDEMPEADNFSAEILKWKIKYSNTSVGKLGLMECLKESYTYYPNIHYLLSLLAVLPVSTCSVERSFSALKRMKTFSRSTTGHCRLNGLAMPYIYRDSKVTVDDILKRWVSKGERRILTTFS